MIDIHLGKDVSEGFKVGIPPVCETVVVRGGQEMEVFIGVERCGSSHFHVSGVLPEYSPRVREVHTEFFINEMYFVVVPEGVRGRFRCVEPVFVLTGVVVVHDGDPNSVL